MQLVPVLIHDLVEDGLEHAARPTSGRCVQHTHQPVRLVVQLPQCVLSFVLDLLDVERRLIGIVGIGSGFLFFCLGLLCRALPLHKGPSGHEEALGRERGHAAGTRGGDGLAPLRVLQVAGRKDPVHVGLHGPGLHDRMAGVVQLHVILKDVAVGRVADPVEQPGHGQIPRFSRGGVLQMQPPHRALGVRVGVGHDGVVVDGDVGVGEGAVLHRLAGAHLWATDQQVHVRTVLGEIHRLLSGRIASAHHSQLLALEKRAGAITNGTGADATAPEHVFTWKVQALGGGTGGQDDGLRLDFAFPTADNKRPLGEIHVIHIFCVQPTAPPLCLRSHAVHEIRPSDALREPWEILHFSREHELATWGPSALQPLEHHWRQIGSCGVDGRSESCGPRSHNHYVLDVVGFCGFFLALCCAHCPLLGGWFFGEQLLQQLVQAAVFLRLHANCGQRWAALLLSLSRQNPHERCNGAAQPEDRCRPRWEGPVVRLHLGHRDMGRGCCNRALNVLGVQQ
mmetsp:Transcript_48320/g.81324  ORF Transcript_48320/g.81324 Transcript_48320/m.81324 type:complete len:509 (-) Transcript_48320:298-1824(-)